jgi:hypothetical protein
MAKKILKMNVMNMTINHFHPMGRENMGFQF